MPLIPFTLLLKNLSLLFILTYLEKVMEPTIQQYKKNVRQLHTTLKHTQKALLFSLQISIYVKYMCALYITE